MRIRSVLELPGLQGYSGAQASGPDDAGAGDVVVDAGPIEGVGDPGLGDWSDLSPRRSVLVKSGVGSILVRDGRSITVDPAPGADAHLAHLAHFVLGPAMGLLLQQRGLYCLHASSVRIGDGAIAFAGDSGSGKSTLAHAMQANGHALITDDIAAIDDAGSVPLVYPGPAALRLWPEGMTSVGTDPGSFETLHDATEKRLIPVDSTVDSSVGMRDPVTLDRVYLLTAADREEVAELTGLEAVVALLRHCVFPELLSGVSGPTALMQQCVRIAKHTRVFRLHRRDDIAALPSLTALLV